MLVFHSRRLIYLLALFAVVALAVIARQAGHLYLGGIISGFVHDEVLDGPYRLVAIDISEDMLLCRTIGNSGDCVGDGLPKPTVFQAGWNAQYIVVARHPRQGQGAPNRPVSEFYYIQRKAGEENVLTRVSVVGPLTEGEYQEEKSRLQLPEFSRIFDDLK